MSGSRNETNGMGNGELRFEQDAPTRDDAIVVDLRSDDESPNWTENGSDDSAERFSEWSDEKARKRLTAARRRLQDVQSEE